MMVHMKRESMITELNITGFVKMTCRLTEANVNRSL